MRPRQAVQVLALIAFAVAVPAGAHGWHGPHVRFGASWGWGGWWYGPWSYGGPWLAQIPVGEPTFGAVDTDISPEHARVFLDGVLLGSADDFDGLPGYLLLFPGRYTLELRLGGYRTLSVPVEIEAGMFLRLDDDLERVPGEERVPWFDRPPKPQTGLVYGTRPVAEPEHQRAFPDTTLRPELDRRAGHGSQRGAVRADAALDLRITPAGASVYLDGEFLGTGGELARLERGVAVGAGEHTIEVMAPGFTARTVALDLERGERREVVVDLEAAPAESDDGEAVQGSVPG